MFMVLLLLLSPPVFGVDCPGLAIVDQPVSSVACPGRTITFTVTATGSGNLEYQWLRDCMPIPGATDPQLTLSLLSNADYGTYSCVISDDCGVLTSEPATLTALPIVITDQPVPIQTCVGLPQAFSVTATGDNLTYQWRMDCLPIPGENGPTLSFDPVTGNDVGTYECVVSNGCSSLTTDPVTLTTPFSLEIATQPQSQVACSGDNVVFSVAAAGTNPISYQWYKNGSLLSGETGSQLQLNGVSTGDNGSYTCDISNLCGMVTSQTATLTVDSGPAFTLQPLSQEVCPNGNATLSVTVAGAEPITYQWRFNGVNIPEQTGASLTLTGFSMADAGTYDCRVTNPCGPATSNVVNLTPAQPFGFSQHPQDIAACPGEEAVFSVTPDGSGPYTYQWRKDCEVLPDETSSTLILASITIDDLGSYSCAVTNDCGVVMSQSAALTYHPNCNIPDMVLRNFLIEGFWQDDQGNDIAIDTNGDGELSEAEVQAVTGTLDCSGLGISDLTGITVFENLTGLLCSHNNLTSVPNLSFLGQLEVLDLSFNRLTDTGNGVTLPAGLAEVNLSYNRLRSLPDLTGLNSLSVFLVSFNLLNSIQPLVDQTMVGSGANDHILVDNNQLDQTSDCSAVSALETRTSAAGAEFIFNPQLNIVILPDWPQSTVLDLLANLTNQLNCNAPSP